MEIRQLTDKDWPALYHFLKDNAKGHCSDRSFNEYWFKTSRYKGWSCMVLEGLDKKLRGIMMFIVVPVWFNGRQQNMAWISTSAVDLSAQKQGAGAMLYLWGYRTFSILGGLAGNENSTPINDILGQKSEDIYMRRYLYLHSSEVCNLCLSKNKEYIRSMALSWKKTLEGGLIARLIANIPKDYNAIWLKFRENFIFTTNRDREYLRWRYQFSPHIKYQFLEMRVDTDLKGFAVIRKQETPYGNIVRVMELISLADYENDTWEAIVSYSENINALFTDFHVIGSFYNKSLQYTGFLESTKKNGLDAFPNLFSPLSHRQWSKTCHFGGNLLKKNKSWLNVDKIYFTKGDSDRDFPTNYELRV
jgi:hypothetical protein